MVSTNPVSERSRDEEAEKLRFIEQIKDTADKLLRDNANRGDIKLISRSLRELRYSFKVLSKYRDRRKVSVFGSARTPIDHPVYQHAKEFGKAMADAGYMIVTGAGPGIMEAAHVGAGTEMSIGLNIMLPFEQYANPVIAGDEKLINLNYFFTRKLLFLKEVDALVLFPGGFGTLDEGFEALTMVQTGKAEMMPIVMVDVPGGKYWEHWAQYVDNCLYQEGMISAEDFYLFRITTSIEDAVREITNFYRIYHSQRYVRGKLVLRLKKRLSDDLVAELQEEFHEILENGEIQQGDAHADESNEPELAHLPRLYLPFDRRSLGRLRKLIDRINEKG